MIHVTMARRIPDDDLLEKAIRSVIGRNRRVVSQAAMTKLVISELRKYDEGYSVSGHRMRRIAAERNILRIEIEYNVHGDTSFNDLCPVCGYPTELINNTTLDDRETDVGRRCTKCTYQTGMKRRTPGRYTFSIVRSTGTAGRISVVKDAEKLIRKAASMVERITKGTEHTKKGKRCAGNIKKIISSKDGLADLIRDMDADLVVHVNRKDI